MFAAGGCGAKMFSRLCLRPATAVAGAHTHMAVRWTSQATRPADPEPHFLRKALAAVVGGGLIGTALALTWEPAEYVFYTHMAMPLMRKMDAEMSHVLAIKFAHFGLAPKDRQPDDPVLATTVWGKKFVNPIGVAAGYDKHAQCIDASFAMGMGFTEIGSVTPEPQPGNPKPRMFRLTEDKAVINRFGFNSVGVGVVRYRLRRRLKNGADDAAREQRRILGVNVGKNKTSTALADDFVTGIKALGPYADFIVVNVSSPNTPGLRALQSKEQLDQLVQETLAARDGLQMEGGRTLPPLLVKIAPDLTEEDKKDIAAVVLERGVDGLIVSNTTITRPPTLKSVHANETGGLSGKPLFEMSTQMLRDMYRLTEGKVPLIGCGGVSSGEDAYAKIKAGASLVEVYSSLAYGGPHLAMQIKRDLARLLKQDGYTAVGDAVGADHRKKD